MPEVTIDDVVVSEKHLRVSADFYAMNDIKAVAVKYDTQQSSLYFAGLGIMMSAAFIGWIGIAIGGFVLAVSLFIEYTDVVITTTSGTKIIKRYIACRFSEEQLSEVKRKANLISISIGAQID